MIGGATNDVEIMDMEVVHYDFATYEYNLLAYSGRIKTKSSNTWQGFIIGYDSFACSIVIKQLIP